MVWILAALLEPIPKAIPYKEFSIQYTSVFNQQQVIDELS